jgi:hypothetical protein
MITQLVKWQRKPKYSEKIRLGATLSTWNPIYPDMELNSGPCSAKPATRRLNYVTTDAYSASSAA